MESRTCKNARTEAWKGAEDAMPRHTAIYTQTSKQIRFGAGGDDPKRNRKPVRILRWLSVLALLGLLFLGFQNAYPSLAGSDIFRLAEISVVGNGLLSREAIVVRSGLTVGGNLFDADLVEAKKDLASLPIVHDALLLRQPPGRLVISVREREPLALVSTQSGLMGLDNEGMIFPLPQASVDLPIVTGMADVACDSLDEAQSERLANLVMFLETLKIETPGFLADVSEVCVTTSAEARVYLVGDGMELRMRLEKADVQARNFGAFVASGTYLGGPPTYVDLRFADQVVVGKRQSGAAG